MRIGLHAWMTAAMLITHALRAQDCPGGRYWNEIFPGYDLQSDIVYGANVNANGQNQQLKFDLYTPKGDTETNRPLVIMAHGGSFIGGSKTQEEVTQFCKALAKRGYVCASIQYRLGLNVATELNATGLLKAVIRAVHDGKALVRFFHKSVVESGNPYGIDTTKMFFGGSSAGGFLALHLQYMDKIEEFAEIEAPSVIEQMGGMEGTSGNPGYTSSVDGVINLCGAMGKAHWLEAGDVPVLQVAGIEDAIVPYTYGTAGIDPILLSVEGAAIIHERAQTVGVTSHLLAFVGANHVPYSPGQDPNAAAYFDTTLNFLVEHLYPLVCSNPPPARRRVQFVHASPDPLLSAVDVFVNDQIAIADARFKTASPPLNLSTWTPNATFRLSIAPAGAGLAGAIHEKQITLSGTDVDAYVVAAGLIGSSDYPFDFYIQQGAIFETTDSQQAYLRVFHGAMAPAVDVLAASNPVVSGLAFGRYNSSYLVLPEGNYPVDIATAGTGDALASFDVAAGAGTAALIVAIGASATDIRLYAAPPQGGELVPIPLHTTARDAASASTVLNLFPHPANETLHFVAHRPVSELTIFDAHGRRVRNLRPHTTTFSVFVADLPPGIYAYRLADGTAGTFFLYR